MSDMTRMLFFGKVPRRIRDMYQAVLKAQLAAIAAVREGIIAGQVDLQARQVIARWPVPEASVQDALALDETNHRVFIACRKPPRFIAFNTDTGKVVANLPCVGVNDDMFYDATHKRIYVTGDGTTSVFQQRDSDHYEHIAEVPTGFQGKTGLFVPELNRLYIELSGAAKPEAKLALMIFEARS